MPLYSLNQEQEINPDFIGLVKGLIDDDEEHRRKHDTYRDSVAHAEEMSVHLFGKKPVALLNLVRPREDPETTTYRLNAYQPTTKATAGKALSIVQKIFNPTLYNIQWPSEASELQKYVMEEYPKYNSVIQFLQKVALKKMLADPNGVIAVTVRNPFISDMDRPEATVKIFGSKNIWWQDNQIYLFFIRKEEQRKGNDVFFFEYYDSNVIVEFTAQKITANDIQVIETSRYEHRCGEVPAWPLSGVPEMLDNGKEIFKSFFEPAIPFWNLAITHESDLFGAFINHLHPIRTELSEECDYMEDGQKCKRGRLIFPTGQDKQCPTCHGSGLKSVKSPYGVYRYNKDKLSEGTATLEPVTYVTVPTEPTKMLEERVEKQHEKGLFALNMDILNKIGENQSGRAKVIDRGELYDFMFNISSIMFDVHLVNIVDFFNKIMFGVSDLASNRDNDKRFPTINKPVQFDISSAVELIAELKEAKEAGINPQYLREKQKSVNDKEFASDPELRRKMALMLDLDPCPEYDVEELDILANRFVPKKFIVIHHNIEYLIEKAIEDKGEKFFNMKKKDQFEVIEKLAEELLEKEIESKIDTSAIDTGNPFGPPGANSNGGNGQPGGQGQGQPNVAIGQGGQQTQEP